MSNSDLTKRLQDLKIGYQIFHHPVIKTLSESLNIMKRIPGEKTNYIIIKRSN